MNKLNKTQEKESAEHCDALEKAATILETAINDYNALMADAFQKIGTATEAYNAAIVAANEFRDDVHSAQEEYHGDKSESWQEGERGQDYEAWMEQWAEELSEVEIDVPAEIEVPDLDHATILGELPTEP